MTTQSEDKPQEAWGPSSAPGDDSYTPQERDDVVRPINWNTLPADQAEQEWLDLNKWVDWLRHTYGLSPTVIPPLWHRHDELVWELSALHLHWLNSYDPDAPPSAPFVWHRDFADARHRLREWVSTCGTRVDRDRPTRQTAWPGETPYQPDPEAQITHRAEDFVDFVLDDLKSRRLRTYPRGTSPQTGLPPDASTGPDAEPAPPFELAGP